MVAGTGARAATGAGLHSAGQRFCLVLPTDVYLKRSAVPLAKECIVYYHEFPFNVLLCMAVAVANHHNA